MIELYAHPFSPYAQTVQCFLEETGLAYKYHTVDPMAGDVGKAALLKVNPLGMVPAIALDGFNLGESAAILRYLALRFQLTSYYPENLEDRARVDEMLEFGAASLSRYLMSLAWTLVWAPRFGLPVHVSTVEEQRLRLAKGLGRFERHMLGRTFVQGATVTLADISLLPFFAMHRDAQVALDDYPATKAWFERMAQTPGWCKVRESYQRALKAMQG